MPAGQTEYALPYIFPWPALAAVFTAQWQAHETSEERPAAMSSSAPLCTGPSAAGLTEAEPMANPSASKTSSRPSAAKKPFSSATHSCNRTCGWILNTPDLLVRGRADADRLPPRASPGRSAVRQGGGPAGRLLDQRGLDRAPPRERCSVAMGSPPG